ncbi:MAG: hypothetical protein K2R98_09610, partial [Gemmataceae bacterium]|nr:hypothetical protein [Gemmataceae bacterium]
ATLGYVTQPLRGKEIRREIQQADQTNAQLQNLRVGLGRTACWHSRFPAGIISFHSSPPF